MDDDEDDLYGSVSAPNGSAQNSHQQQNHSVAKQEDSDDEDDSGSDSDIDIITERAPDDKKAESQQPTRPTTITSNLKPSDSQPLASSTSSASPRPSSTQPKSRYSAPQSSKPGSSYPAISTSTLDPNGETPYFTLPDGTSKPITEVDFDADLAEHSKPWRLPGTDQSDYFNYGFDEFTWATYCMKQKEMRNNIENMKEENRRFEMMLGGGMPGMSGPTGQGQVQGQNQGAQGPMGMGGPGPMGMPPDMNPEMMSAMMSQMMASGMNPQEMDFNSFMQAMQGMQGGGMPGQGMPGMQMPGQGGPPQNAPSGPGQGSQGGAYGGGGGGRRRGRW